MRRLEVFGFLQPWVKVGQLGAVGLLPLHWPFRQTPWIVRPAEQLALASTGIAGRRPRAGSNRRRPGRAFLHHRDRVLQQAVRRDFKAITRKAGIGNDWTPRELRHSFISIMSDNEIPIETIADLVGHSSTAVTEEVYRHQLKPVITKGAETMNDIFTHDKKTKSA